MYAALYKIKDIQALLASLVGFLGSQGMLVVMINTQMMFFIHHSHIYEANA